MSSWNVAYDGTGALVLLNGHDTLVGLNRRIGLGVVSDLMNHMESLSVPISYTEGVSEIYLTYLMNGLEGDYIFRFNKIRLSCKNEFISTLHETLIHELGHHIDSDEAISEKEDLVDEWFRMSSSFDRHGWRRSDDCYLYTSPEEYFASGFESFYVNKDDLAGHPVLFHYIKRIHAKNVKK